MVNMQITLVQTEIEQALKNFIFSQVNIREGMDIKIDLRATRGAEGFQAIIDIVPSDVPQAPAAASTASQAPTTPQGPVNRVAATLAPVRPAAVAVASAPQAVREPEPEQGEDKQESVEQETTQETDAKSAMPEKKTLFGNLKNLKSTQQD